MFNLQLLATLVAAEGEVTNELFMPTTWFGIIMFCLLMFALLVTVSFSSKGKELPAREH